jgi:broad specificity phosphatase PhoE
MDRIYLRHGDKGYKNGQSETDKHDPPLTAEGREESRRVALELWARYGSPQYIVTSPYERARMTAIEMASVLPEPVDIWCDNRLSEYLGNHYSEPLDVTPETEQYGPPHPERIRDLKTRIRKHFYQRTEGKGLIWHVTHGLVITCITELLGKKVKTFPSLGGIYVPAGGPFFQLEWKKDSPCELKQKVEIPMRLSTPDFPSLSATEKRRTSPPIEDGFFPSD